MSTRALSLVNYVDVSCIHVYKGPIPCQLCRCKLYTCLHVPVYCEIDYQDTVYYSVSKNLNFRKKIYNVMVSLSWLKFLKIAFLYSHLVLYHVIFIEIETCMYSLKISYLTLLMLKDVFHLRKPSVRFARYESERIGHLAREDGCIQTYKNEYEMIVCFNWIRQLSF